MSESAHTHPWKISDVVMFPLLAIGILLEFLYPTRPEVWPNLISAISGICIIALGLRLINWSKASLDTAGQPNLPGSPTTQLVTSDAFSLSRNPNYLGAILIAAGITTVSLSLWFLALTAAAVIILHHWMIAPEEKYLRDKFGEDYSRYCKKVPRWF